MLAKGELRVYKALYLNKEGLHIRDISRKAELTLPAVSKHIAKGEENRLIPFTRGLKAIGGKTTAYICENYSCKTPLTDPEAFAKAMASRPTHV